MGAPFKLHIFESFYIYTLDLEASPLFNRYPLPLLSFHFDGLAALAELDKDHKPGPI